MPKSDKHSTIARQWQMLTRIPTRLPGISVSELCAHLREEGFPVSPRTVERDLNGLSAIFDLTNEQEPNSRAQRWYYVSGKVPEIGSIDLAEAVSLALAGDVLEKLLPGVLLQPVSEKIKKARSKLLTLKQIDLARWSEKVRYTPGSMELQPPIIQPRIMNDVQTALMEERQLEIRYDPFQKKTKTLRIHPLSLVLRGSVPYLVATTFEYTRPVLYAVHRIRKTTLLEDKVNQPADYSIDDYLTAGAMNFATGKTLEIKANLTEELASYLSETPLSKDQKIDYGTKPHHLTATVKDSWQLHFWLMSQGPGITILSPQHLRDRMKSSLSNALANYSK